jgi:hypothetical protein
MHRTSKQGDLSETFVPVGFGRSARLERITVFLDWHRLEQRMSPISAAFTRRLSYPPLVLFKALLLQQ